MSDPVEIRVVASWRDRRRFQKLPWTIYGGDPNWVPPLLADERQMLGWGRHPFYDNAEAVTLLALRGGRAVGRLAVIVNDVHNRQYNEKRGFFGFFECIDDAAFARSLFDAGGAWLRERGMTAVRGPVNPSQNYTCGLLISGFDTPPCFMMTYNKPYYAALIEACGFAKSQDLYSYEMDAALLAKLAERYKPVVKMAMERPGFVVRPLDRANFKRDVTAYLEIYNRSLEGTWGFTPLQLGETLQIAKEMGYVIIPSLALFAEVEGEPIGAVFALLDYNQIIRKLNGRLLPLGIVRILMGRRRIDVARGLAINMMPGYQRSGLGVVLLDQLTEAAKLWGIKRWEFSWVLESNKNSRGSLERAGMTIAKTYRIYDAPL